jgi:putative MATE family efflux protein
VAEQPRELEKGDLTKHLLYLAVPIFITNMMQNFFSVFDMFLLGKIGVAAQAAISITGFIFGTFWSMIGGLGTAAIAFASRYCGRKDYSLLKKTVVNTVFAAYALTIVYVALCFIFRDRMLVFFGAKGATLEMARAIYQICLISLLNDSGLFVFFAILRATGYIHRHFYILFISVILNTVFEPLFIYGWLGFPKMGIQGAPIARFMSYFIMTFIMITILTNSRGVLRVERRGLKLDLKFLFEYIGVSLPAVGQGLIPTCTGLILLKLAAPYGDTMLATMGIGGRIDNFVMMIGWAISSSVSVMVGHNLGAKEPGRAEISVITGLKLYTAFTFACFMICFFFSEQVIGVFNKDPGVIHYASMYLKTISPLYLLMGVSIITGAAFNGAGETKTPLVINAFAFILIQVPVALVLTRIPSIGARGIFIATASVFAFQGIVGWIMYRRGGWKNKKIA